MNSVLHMLSCDSVSLPDVGQICRYGRTYQSDTEDSILSADNSSSTIAESHSGVTRNKIRVVVLSLRFIKNLRRMADLRRAYELP